MNRDFLTKDYNADQLGLFTENNDIDPTYVQQQKNYINPDTLCSGDYIRVQTANGYFEGVFAFSGQHISSLEKVYYYEKVLNGSLDEENEKTEVKFDMFSGSDKVELLSCNELYNEHLPNEDNALKSLVEALQEVSLDKRINSYYAFKERYSQKDKGLFQHLNQAWCMAIEAATTLTEVEQYILSKSDAGRTTYKPAVKEYLEQVFNNIERSKRVQYICGVMWTQEIYSKSKKETYFYAAEFLNSGLFNGIYGKLLEATDDKTLFFRILDNWGRLSGPSNEIQISEKYNKIHSDEKDVSIWLKKPLSTIINIEHTK